MSFWQASSCLLASERCSLASQDRFWGELLLRDISERHNSKLAAVGVFNRPRTENYGHPLCLSLRHSIGPLVRYIAAECLRDFASK